MSRSRVKEKGRSECGQFAALPKRVFATDEFMQLSAGAVKLLINIYLQYTGSNNGDLTASWTVMKKQGFKSKGTLHRALHELLARGWLMVTRQGGRHKASLYAVTFRRINECLGKDLDVRETLSPYNLWRSEHKSSAPNGGTLTRMRGN